MTFVKFRPIEKEVINHFNQRFGNGYMGFQNTTTIHPVVNVKETDKNFELDLVAAGLKKEDFNIKIDKNTLTVFYEQKDKNGENAKKYIRREFAYHSFKRSFRLPETVSKEGIIGKYEGGILTITLPKKEVEPAKEIKIS